MLKIYDVNKKNSYPLIQYKEYYVESFLKTGDKELSFSIPIQAKYADLIQEEGYVENKDDYFVIKSINKSGDYKVIKAQLDLEELEGKEWEKFESVEQTIDGCLKLAVAGTGWLIKNNGIIKKRTIRKSYCSALDVIQQARKTYRVEFEFDTKNKIINIYEKLGANKGSFLMDSLNLKKLEEQGNTYDFYTRMIAIGATDEKGNILKTTVTNNSYSSKVKTVIWKDERYTILDDLKEDAQAKLDEISKPYKAYSATPYKLDNASIGDTITIIDKYKNIKGTWRIISYKRYPEEVGQDSIEIANAVLTFEDIQKDFESAADTLNNITSDNATISPNAVKTAFNSFNIINTQELNAVKANIGELYAGEVIANILHAYKANIDDLNAKTANIKDLTAENLKFTWGEGESLTLQELLTNILSADDGHILHLTGDNVVLDSAIIKDANIVSLSAGKMTSGTLDTNKVTVQSSDGNMTLRGSFLQFKDKNDKVRIQLGLDGNKVYSLKILDENGNIQFDTSGVTREGLNNGIIDDSKISDDANINGKKIDIDSLVTVINGDNSVHFKSSKVELDTVGQTLDIAFNDINTKQGQNSEAIQSNQLKIEANTKNIKSLLQDTTIEKDGSNIKLKDAYSDLMQEIDGISLKANEAETTVKNFVVGSANMLQNGALEKSLEFWITDIFDDYIKFVEGHTYIDLSKLSGTYSISQSVPINTDSTYGAQINVISLKKNLILRVIASNAKGEVINKEEYIIDKTGVSYVYIKAEKASYLKYELILNGGEIYELYHAQLERGNVISDFKESDNDTNLKFKRTENSIETVDAKNSQLNVKVDGIDSHVSNIQKTVNYHGNDIVTIQAQISEAEQKITPDAIVSTVTKSKIYTDNLNGKVDTSTYQSKITQLATMIEQRVKNSDYESKISQLADSISSKVESDKLSSLIKQNIDSVAYAFNGYSPSVTVKKDGLHLYNCGLTVKTGGDDSSETSLWVQTNGLIGSYTGYGVYSKSTGYGVHFHSTGAYACPRVSDGKTGPFTIHTNDRVIIMNSGGTKDMPNMGSNRMGITAGGAIFDTLWVKGSKTRAVKFSDGEYYGYNAVESAECYFSDEGKAITNQNCECEITLDKKFLEGVNTKDYDYNVFLTKYGKGDIWVEEQSSNSFLVKSDKPNLKFTWIVHCKQRDYETVRLQKANKEDID